MALNRVKSKIGRAIYQTLRDTHQVTFYWQYVFSVNWTLMCRFRCDLFQIMNNKQIANEIFVKSAGRLVFDGHSK